MSSDFNAVNGTPRGGLLDLIEKAGNKLPDPNTLFIIGLVFVMIASYVAATFEWKVPQQRPVAVMEMVTDDLGVEREQYKLDEQGRKIIEWRETSEPLRAQNLLSRDGAYWLIRNLVANFMAFPPLGVVLVGMLGIGVAERTGLIGACLKTFMLFVPGKLLTPSMVFIGIMSSLALDAGYVVLPPLAAALYLAVGRSPLAGLAAVFAGVSGGFGANLLITGLDPMMAELSNLGVRVLDPDYEVNAACNWYFMIASTFVVTLAGWATTSWFVERRLSRKSPDEGGPMKPSENDLVNQRLNAEEVRGLKATIAVMILWFIVMFSAILIPGAPLHTYKMPDPNARNVEEARWVAAEIVDMTDRVDIPRDAWLRDSNGNDRYDAGELVLTKATDQFDRWVRVIVPLIFLSFLLPGIVYGIAIKTIRSDKDVAVVMVEAMKAMAPIIVLAFFAAQFIKALEWTNLDKMMAMSGGQLLGDAGMPVWLLLIAFIIVTMVFNLFIGSMSAKYTMFAPIFIPMFMMVGISPELTQAAYRVGDSVTNIITPLNAYLVIILVFMQKYVPKAGMGTLISTMLPYSIVFAIVWTLMLLIWVALGIPLGVDGGLVYPRVD